MGTSNAGCVLTGLEIEEGAPAYLVILHKRAIEYEGHFIMEPPILGIYDGVGSISVTEDVPCLNLKAGDVWPSEEEDMNASAIALIHPEIFGALGALETYDSSHRTIGEAVAAEIDEIKAHIQRRNGLKKEFRDPDRADREIPDMIVASTAFKEVHRSVWVGKMNAVPMDLRDTDRLESAFNLLGRALTLRKAEMQLRRPLVPVTWGPQETGDKARIALFDLAADIARKRS